MVLRYGPSKASLTRAPHGWGGYVCQLCQRMAKYVIFIDNLYQTCTTRGYVCQFWGPHHVSKHTFSGKFIFLLFVSHISFGPLRQPFELKDWAASSKCSAGCGYTNATCSYLAKEVKNIKLFFRNFPKVSKTQKWKIWGLTWNLQQWTGWEGTRRSWRLLVRAYPWHNGPSAGGLDAASPKSKKYEKTIRLCGLQQYITKIKYINHIKTKNQKIENHI